MQILRQFKLKKLMIKHRLKLMLLRMKPCVLNLLQVRMLAKQTLLHRLRLNKFMIKSKQQLTKLKLIRIRHMQMPRLNMKNGKLRRLMPNNSSKLLRIKLKNGMI